MPDLPTLPPGTVFSDGVTDVSVPNGGVMNLAVIAALTAFVAFEKLAPFGINGARASGVLLLAAGVWMILV